MPCCPDAIGGDAQGPRFDALALSQREGGTSDAQAS